MINTFYGIFWWTSHEKSRFSVQNKHLLHCRQFYARNSSGLLCKAYDNLEDEYNLCLWKYVISRWNSFLSVTSNIVRFFPKLHALFNILAHTPHPMREFIWIQHCASLHTFSLIAIKDYNNILVIIPEYLF